MTELQLHGGRAAAQHRFDVQAREYLSLYKSANWWDAGLYSIMDGMSALAVGLMVTAAAYLMGLGDTSVTLGLIVAFIDYLTKVFVPIREFSGKFLGGCRGTSFSPLPWARRAKRRARARRESGVPSARFHVRRASCSLAAPPMYG